MTPPMASLIFVLIVPIVSMAGSLTGQRAPVAAISDAQRAHLRTDPFQIVTAIRGLPLGVREELQKMWRTGTLDIAEPDPRLQGVPISRTLSSRLLVVAACSTDQHCLVHYERTRGEPAWIVMLFHWSPSGTTFEGGGTVTRGLKTIEEVRQAFVSGAIGPSEVW